MPLLFSRWNSVSNPTSSFTLSINAFRELSLFELTRYLILLILDSLYGGRSSKIYILPISTPGLNVHHLHPLPSQKGIVSSISIALDQESGKEILAVGTFSGNTGIYSLDFGGWNEFDPDRAGTLTCLKGWKEEDGSGVSQVSLPGSSKYSH